MKSIEAKVGALVVACALILCATVYYIRNEESGSKQVPYRRISGMQAGWSKEPPSCLAGFQSAE